MNCREAQALIVPFIEGKLTDEQNEAFIEHIEGCSDCCDELEVYYIVMVGVKQLDEDEHMLVDFKGGLRQYIDSKKDLLARKHSRSTRLKITIFSSVAFLAFVSGFLWYNIYNHPDLSARYAQKILSSFDVELQTPDAQAVTLVTRNVQDYFGSRTLDMPLRRIQTINEKGTEE